MNGAPRRITPARGPVDALVHVPGSKSIANRALVCAALADGTSTVRGSAPGDDTAAMIDCLRAFGLHVEVDSDIVVVRGGGGELPPGPVVLPTRLAGTTSRFVTALAALGAGPYTVDGEPPLRRRPMLPLHEALVAMGATVTPVATPGHLPVSVAGPPTSGVAAIAGDVSSQYVTALMLIGPYLPGGLDLRLTSELVSRPYVAITAGVMETFGIHGIEITARSVSVPPGRYAAIDFVVEPDASSASYPLAVAALVGGSIGVAGLGASSMQGDRRFADLLGAMGCRVQWTDHSVRVERSPGAPITGIDVDMAEVSDLVPTLAVVAATATTPTRIRGVGFIRAKESDRLGDLALELQKLGADVNPTADGLEIRPVDGLRGARLGTHHDHRLAMAFGVLGTAVGGVEVEDPSVVSKSWPDFWQLLDGVVGAP